MLARGTPAFIAVPPALVLVLAIGTAQGALPATPWTMAPLALLALVAGLGLAFFRDPHRPVGEGIVAPAHGRVLSVDEEGGSVRVSTFMGPMDVHVVRAPLAGRVVFMERGGSGFRRADTPGAGRNVHLRVGLEGGDHPFEVVMVSGWFARRIVPYVATGDRVERGSRIGLIRFGSRVDVAVPMGDYEITARAGDRVRAGSSSLGVRTDAGH